MSNLEPIEENDLNLKEKFVENPSLVKENKPGISMGNTMEAENAKESFEQLPEKENFYDRILHQLKDQSHPAVEKDIPLDANAVAQYENAEKKVDELVNIAVHKGVIHAVKVARHLDDNYSLDELHGRLHGEALYEELLKKGLIKKL